MKMGQFIMSHRSFNRNIFTGPVSVERPSELVPVLTGPVSVERPAELAVMREHIYGHTIN